MRGIITGLGGRCRCWIDVFRRKNIEIAACVEPVAERRQKTVEAANLPRERVFGSLTEALAKCQADFVMDVTPPKAHEPIAMEAFKAGLHVIGEKPLSDDLAAAKRVVQAGKKAGRVHMITQNYRFGAVPRTTNRLLKEGVIGKPEHVLLSFFMSWADAPGSHYVTEPYMLVKDMGVHHFDMMRYVLGREVESVLAHTWNPSWGWHKGDACHTAIFQMSGGLTATHHALGCSKGHRTGWNADWHIAGSEGSITWEGNSVFLTHGHKTANPGRTEVKLDPLPEEPLDAIMTEFLTAIEEKRQPECSSEDNLKSLAMTFAVVQSAIEKRWVKMSELLA
jgi:predicted dehydrogenase